VIIEGYGYTATVQTAAGSSTYSITIPKATGVSYEGKAVTFRVGSAAAIQTSAWAMGDNVLVNLIASTP
jgi:Na+/serine symporter